MVMKQQTIERLIFILAAAAFCILAIVIIQGCKTPNLIVASNEQVKASGKHHAGHLAAWIEADTAVTGHAISEMGKDSFYTVRTSAGWTMKIKYDRLMWDFQLKPRPHFPDPVPKKEEPRYHEMVVGFSKYKDVDYGF